MSDEQCEAGLLPCPFCNSAPEEEGREQGGYWVKCENFGRGCGVSTFPRMTAWGARQTWNRRIGVQTPDEIAAAIAAARAEGEKAGRDAGVAIGAANMRETCASRIDDLHAPFSYAEIASFMRSTPLPTDATAVLAAERAAGRAEMRRACVTLVRQTNMVDSDPESLSDEIRALVLP